MIKRIVLTGEPSSGKSTVKERIPRIYTPLGYEVILVEETATYLINSGITFGENKVNIVDFQELVMNLQLAKEEIVERYINMLGKRKYLIIYDRGTIDNSVYVNKAEFEEVLARVKKERKFAQLMLKYDLVIDFIGSKAYYTTENNKARSETVEEAIALREKTLKSWLGHPNIKFVLPKPDMEDKINEALNIINEELNEEKVKRQEKYLVDLTKSKLEYLKEKGRPAKITQDYLKCSYGYEKRLRKVELNDSTYYSLTTYEIKEDGRKVIVNDEQLDEKTYEHLLEFKEENTSSIQKTRIYFGYNGKYFYLDIFDNNAELGILEINVLEDEIVETPDFLHVVENVTNDVSYYNKCLALRSESSKLTLRNKGV